MQQILHTPERSATHSFGPQQDASETPSGRSDRRGPEIVTYSIEKLVPQPHAEVAFGLRTVKWLPISSSV